MRRLGTLTAVVGLVAAFTMAFAAVPKVAQANPPCNTVLPAGTTTLNGNLDCSGTTGLIIGVDGTTVDLGGFVLTGDPSVGASYGVDNTGGFDNVTIKNGVIEGFEQGVRAVGADGLTLKDLTFTGQTSSHAVDIHDSADVQIKDSSFTMPVPSFSAAFVGSPEAIRLGRVDHVQVKNVDVHGGFVGVNFACDSCDGLDTPTNGEVKDSTFHGTFIGVLLANTTDAKVENNHVSGVVRVDCVHVFCPLRSKGISADADFGSGTIVSGVKIEKNHVHDNDGIGIRLKGVIDSEVKGNKVHVNTLDGIALVANTTPDPDVGSTGNEITDNTSNGNGGFDMFHDEDSSPNEWEDNICGTSSGADIDC